MKIAALLSADRVCLDALAQTKKKALETLSELFRHDTPDIAAADMLSSLCAREKLGSTGLGHGVAIPHGRLAGLNRCIGAFIRLPQAIDYDAHDGQPVDLIFALLVPQEACENHIKHLAAIAEMFSDPDFCRRIREMPNDREAVYQQLCQTIAA
ncbi:PTS transporter subunit EIIA [Sinimarinibacterium sp. NLF-5-8]|nr:PTS transporter subunit EIIA [Sinimarinibacterium sp. NLF-5-8]